jgi:glycosyltransferase involved in cell wall biosynthesis
MQTMLKILCFHNAPHRASYRYRVGQFLPYWASYHIEMQAVCISGKQYVNLLRFLFAFHKYDYVLLQKKIVPRILIKIMTKQSKLIYDFDDALYTRESRELEQNKPPSHSTIKKLNYILKKSTLVFAGSPELAQYSKTYNDNVHIIPTALDKQRAEPMVSPQSDSLTIGWIGNDVNLYYLSIIDDATLFLQQKYPAVRFSLLCGNPPKELKTPWHFTKWSSAAETSWLHSLDIGIMPLTDDPWSRGKCAFKLLQYMACGKPVVASDVGANRNAVSNNINGYLASTTEEWIYALEQLILHKDMRLNMGKESLKIFTEQFERSRIQQKISDILFANKENRPKSTS